ncbi:MAG TPA: alpha-L-fucosidase, partial [Pirellulales bacterium]|nr:alpha-L-fucosidase [Pirellulales bacterium]
AYYYNRGEEWGKQVSITTKKAAYSPTNDNTATIGSIIDFEKVGARSPSAIRTGSWQVDDPIAGNSWGYVRDLRLSKPETILSHLIDTVSKNGNYVLNISPMADGTIPDDQQAILLEVGKWLEINGEAIYDTHNWIQFGEGGSGKAELNIRFTVKDQSLYAMILGNWPNSAISITALASGRVKGKIVSVALLGHDGDLEFSQDTQKLKVELPAEAPCKYAYSLKITGLTMDGPTATPSGNPLASQSSDGN